MADRKIVIRDEAIPGIFTYHQRETKRYIATVPLGSSSTNHPDTYVAESRFIDNHYVLFERTFSTKDASIPKTETVFGVVDADSPEIANRELYGHIKATIGRFNRGLDFEVIDETRNVAEAKIPPISANN